ncbi:hypothetical protein CSB09_03645 [Candidatus Gracilibacteria bacterium]|nr:MAG: hypothetical protein CSB09_03645 [Candidatus Gracilibacteria bacterium]
MKIRPKTPEELQAQIEDFADHGFGEFSQTQKIILKNAQKLSTITSQKDIEHPKESISKDMECILYEYGSSHSPLLWEQSNFSQSLYTQHLTKRNKRECQMRKHYLTRYKEEFKDSVDGLQKNVSKDSKDYIGSGWNGDVFMITGKDKKKYALKISQSMSQANFELKTLFQSRRIKNTPEIQAYWAPEGAIIMNYIPGTDVSKITPNTPNYTKKQMAELIETVIELDNNGLIIDPHPSNFIYHRINGFSVIDFHLKEPGEHTPIEKILSWLNVVIRRYSFNSICNWHEDMTDAIFIKVCERYFENLIGFLEILQEKGIHIQEVRKSGLDLIFENEKVKGSPQFRNYIKTIEALNT